MSGCYQKKRWYSMIYCCLGIFWCHTHSEIFCIRRIWNNMLLSEGWWDFQARTSTSSDFPCALSLSPWSSISLLPQKVSGLFIGGLNAASSLSVIIGVIFGANMTIAGSLTTGALTSFILYSFTGKFHAICNIFFMQMEASLFLYEDGCIIKLL